MTNSSQIEAKLCAQIKRLRLSANMTQKSLADLSGASLRTINRMEKGEGITLDTLIRVMMALKIETHLDALLPDPALRPLERIQTKGKMRERARPTENHEQTKPWAWGEDD
jgi:transcriptional regulator with XRE-family HTH domain